MTNIQEKPKKTKENRILLQSLSLQAKQAEENNPTSFFESTVNQLLIRHIYNPTGEYIFHSFNEWSNLGFRIRKGEKAYLFWSKPKGKAEAKDTDEIEDEEDKQFFIAYLFSSRQVEKK